MSLVNISSGAGTARLGTALMAGLLLLSASAAAQSTVDFTVSGTSTVRGWTCAVTGTAEVTAGSAAPAPGFASGVQAATLTVQVRDFECPNAEMTEHLMEALKPDEFAEITFRLDSYEPAGPRVRASGTLTIHDVTQAITIPVTLTPGGQGVAIEGETSIDMTTYGVEPPVVMLGLMKVGPQVRIEFEGLIAP